MTYQPGHPGQSPQPAVKRRHGLPVLIVGLVIVLIIAGLRGVQLHGTSDASAPPTSGSPTDTSGATAGVLADDAPTTLAAQLSYEIANHNKAAFMSHMSGSAKTQAGIWWDNMAAIGYDDAEMAAAPNAIFGGDKATGSFVAELGIHSRMGPVDTTESPATKFVPGTEYRITMQAQQDNTSPLVTGWQGLSNAPWDSERLYVVHTAHAVTAGPFKQKTFIRNQAKVAERAASWLLKFLGEYNDFVHQKGFVDFVSSTPAQRGRWFTTSPKPRGWVSDPTQLGGFFKPLPSVLSTDNDTVTTLPCGGGYVVVGTKIPGVVNDTGVLVHEFTHDLLSINDVWSFGTSKPLPAWVVEGFARYVEAYYHNTPNDPTPRTTTAKPFLSQALVQEPHPRFSGHVPTDAQLYDGSATSGYYYYNVSATVYEYLSVKYGSVVGFHSALIAYLGGSDGPFAAVLKSTSHGTQHYYPPSQIRAQWARWYRANYSG